MSQGEHHAGTETQIQHDLCRIIEKAQSQPITDEEARMLIWGCGLTLKGEK